MAITMTMYARIRHPIRRLALTAAVCAALAGCAEMMKPKPPDLSEVWAGYIPGVSPIYCYQTLAAPDCYANPQPGPPNRLINAYTQEPEE